MRIKPSVMLVIYAGFACLLTPSLSLACSCLSVGTLQQERARSTTVFLGQVSSIEQRSAQMDKSAFTRAWEWTKALFGAASPNESENRYNRVGFEVKQTIKGSAQASIELSTGLGGGDCGYEFELGSDYWVYARGTGAALTVSICSLTSPAPTKPHAAK